MKNWDDALDPPELWKGKMVFGEQPKVNIKPFGKQTEHKDLTNHELYVSNCMDVDDAANGVKAKWRKDKKKKFEDMTMEERVEDFYSPDCDYPSDGLNCVRGIFWSLAIELGFAALIVAAVVIYITVTK